MSDIPTCPQFPARPPHGGEPFIVPPAPRRKPGLSVLSVNGRKPDGHGDLALTYIDGAEYAAGYGDPPRPALLFRQGSEVVAVVDATPFLKDGMVSSVAVSGGNLVVTFNTDAGKEPVEIPLTDIFDPDDYYDSDAVDGLLDDKVDKVEGKGLSTNDYTTAEKQKLAGIAAGAQVNVIETVKVNGTALSPSGKAVDITVPTVPTNVSAFTNDAGYLTAHQSWDDVKPSGGIAASDLAAAVQDSLGKADTALQAQDITGKADMVANATHGHFAALTSTGNLVDSGKKAADFAADNAVVKLTGNQTIAGEKTFTGNVNVNGQDEQGVGGVFVNAPYPILMLKELLSGDDYMISLQFDIGNRVWFLSIGNSSYSNLLSIPDESGTLALVSQIPAASTSTPQMDGTASAGSSTSWAKGDHVHPTDTSRAAASHTHTASDVTGLGDAATKNVGTTSGTVAAGDDSRFSDARTPTAHKSSHAAGGSDAIAPSDIGAAASSHTHAASDITPGLAAVATSGDYDDLTNKPTIPAAQVQSNWNETDTSSKAYIQNKPTIPTIPTPVAPASATASGQFADALATKSELAAKVALEEFSSGSWAQGSSYSSGDIVFYDGFIYLCSSDVSSSSTPPSEDPTHWDQVAVNYLMFLKADRSDIPSPSSTTPLMDGTAAVGVSDDYARADHVHPSDTSKADASSLAPAFSSDSTVQYAVGSHCTYNGKLYKCTTATTGGTWVAGNWAEDTMTDPDAVLDVMAQNRLRVVAKDGTLLWAQGYDLASASSATLACDAVNNFTFADGATSQAFTLPAAPTGKVGDFGLDIDNSANASAATMTLTGLDTAFSVVVPKGKSLNDMLAIAAGELARFYITLSTFRVNNLPTWHIAKLVVENGGATA